VVVSSVCPVAASSDRHSGSDLCAIATYSGNGYESRKIREAP
jgi:hypothetical protein